MILLTVFLRLQNKKCDNFFFYVIGTNRDFPIIDVLYTNCVHLFIDLRTKNDFLHFFGSRDFFFCVARNLAWSRAVFENRHYKLISRHFELFYNEHMCLVMNAHTHTHNVVHHWYHGTVFSMTETRKNGRDRQNFHCEKWFESEIRKFNKCSVDITLVLWTSSMWKLRKKK